MAMLVTFKDQVIDTSDHKGSTLVALTRFKVSKWKAPNDRGDYRKQFTYGRRRNPSLKDATEWNSFLDALDAICNKE